MKKNSLKTLLAVLQVNPSVYKHKRVAHRLMLLYIAFTHTRIFYDIKYPGFGVPAFYLVSNLDPAPSK